MKIPRGEGESARKKLLEASLLDISLKIRGEGEYLLLPVNDPEAMGEMDLMLADFEERDVLETDYRRLVKVPSDLAGLLPTSYDVVGDIAIVRLVDELLPFRRNIGDAMREALSRLRTVAMDKGVQGEFRVREIEIISGGPSTITMHTEFGLHFKVDVSKVYFNPRLASERWRISSLVGRGETVIDMFAGVGPFSIMIAKYASAREIHGIDMNPEAVALMKENIVINKVKGVNPLLGDARELIGSLPPADRIIMNLPHSAHEFLEIASMNLNPMGIIHFYTICEREAIDGFVGDLVSELKGKGIDLDLMRLEELKTYSPTMSVYSADLVLIHRPCSPV
ncbi:MAG: class I SAM-dependent methyltransferase family protein [Methanomassiliicoccales archaeon]|nr:class I SAM-dependent methyltransferase family protein [Methanomassiliicoccales archaeon]